ncbi:hypothetical protein NDU88_007708 [Pleurodeles waltl]|uniref:Uncharacterized protein n=1 Tax=Pleurodeles waltl TaxID=8319 RepID=A0AAV7RUU8_PLEWA|nr:hypothetical protein NDU88_007708 [Pleurodeles waltl]
MCCVGLVEDARAASKGLVEDARAANEVQDGCWVTSRSKRGVITSTTLQHRQCDVVLYVAGNHGNAVTSVWLSDGKKWNVRKITKCSEEECKVKKKYGDEGGPNLKDAEAKEAKTGMHQREGIGRYVELSMVLVYRQALLEQKGTS